MSKKDNSDGLEGIAETGTTQKLIQQTEKNTKSYSLDTLLVGKTIDEQRTNFHFPEDFSFKDDDFRHAVDYLYGRRHFKINYFSKLKEEFPKVFKSETLKDFGKNTYNLLFLGHAERKEKRKVRRNYHEKCKEYFVEHHHWPKRVAGFTAAFIGLPRYKEHKTTSSYVLSAVPAALVGNLPERYAAPMAKIMNVEQKFLTKSSIGWDIFNLGLVGTWAYSMWTGNEVPQGPIERLYESIGVGEDILKWALTANAATRLLEIPVRLWNYMKNGAHTSSPATAFPINPDPINGIPTTYLFGHDIVRRVKEYWHKTKTDSTTPFVST